MYESLLAIGSGIASWPPAVLGTISGSVITLIGVFFSDWRNTIRLEKQHKFAAQESERTRIAEVRKDVYLSATGVLSRVQEYLLGLPEGVEYEEGAPTVDLAELVGKVSLVGETSTVILAQQLAADYLEAYAQLLLIARGPREAKQDALRHAEYRMAAMEQAKRVDLEIAQYLEKAATEAGVFEALQRSRATFQVKIQEHWAQEINALNRVSAELNKYIVLALPLIEKLGEKGVELLLAVREELGHKTNRDDVLRAVTENRNRSLSALRDALAKIERERSPKNEGEKMDVSGAGMAAE